MIGRIFRNVLILFVGVFAVGCAAPQFRPTPFTPHRFEMNQYASKVDNAIILFDASSSMTRQIYKGRPKINIAKDFVYHLNQTIPDLEMKAGLRVFGQNPSVGPGNTVLVYGITDYSKSGLNRGIDAIHGHGDITPVSAALKGVGKDLEPTQGPIALIVVSDGKDPDIPKLPIVDDVKALKDKYRDRLCIYAVGIGDDQEGMKRMKKIAHIGHCGFFVNAEELASPAAMADFVERVFLTKLMDSDGDGVYDKNDQCPDTPLGVKVDDRGCPLPKPKPALTPPRKPVPPAPADSDGDGVVDNRDKCPNTPRGTKVDADGCRILGMVHFDFDKWNIKPQYKPTLNEAAGLLKDNPSVRMEIHGHTDSIGTAEYNQVLSERRAQSVEQYLIGKGIDAGRLSILGHGFRQPIATNKTDQGRARNRRAELKLIH